MWIYVRDELETTFVLYHKASIAGEEKNVLNNTIEQIIDVGSFEVSQLVSRQLVCSEARTVG